MAKKGFGRFVAFAAATGAVAAGISYVLQYKMFHKELEKDFCEFEDGDEPEEQEAAPSKTERNYISLHSSKDEFKVAAKDMANATRNVLKDAGAVLSDTAHEAMSVAVDSAHLAFQSMKARKDGAPESPAAPEEADEAELFEEEDEGFLDDDYVDDDSLFDYERMEGVENGEPQIQPVSETLPEAEPENTLTEDAPEALKAAPEAAPEPISETVLQAEEPDAAPAREAKADTATIEEDTMI